MKDVGSSARAMLAIVIGWLFSRTGTDIDQISEFIGFQVTIADLAGMVLTLILSAWVYVKNRKA